MDLSIIIVNYNARAFLDLCLQSVEQAIKEIDAEVIVVDNASSDGAPEMVKQKHPWVKLVANTDNAGFSKANNQGIEASKGELVVIQNPDTIVAEDTYEKCITFLRENIKAGAVGVRMLDGSGKVLPESKRGIPTPMISFFKAFGLSNLFPKSAVFSRYYLGHLDLNENNPVEILAGAFICVRKDVLNKAGSFDEDFFMFGEDIDLSYRFLKEGFENWYLADAPIIHFKGESSKKTDEIYLNSFFGAMDIFYKKHFSRQGGWLFKRMISMGIGLKRMQFKRKAKKVDRSWTKVNSFPKDVFIVESEQGVSLPASLSKETNIHTVKSFSELASKHRGAAILFTRAQSFKEIIDFMNAHPGKFKYFFQSVDAGFLLGSLEKEHPGMVWA